MSIIKTVPPSSKFIQADCFFTGTFNAPTLGKYDFSIPGNAGIVLLEPLNITSIYVIDRYSFSAQLPEGDYLESIDTLPTAQITKRIDGLPVYYKPIPCINYVDNAECLAYFFSRTSAKEQAQKDALTVTFRGSLNQTPAMVGLASVRCLLSMSIYEIIDKKVTQEIRESSEKNYTFIKAV